MIDSYVFLTPFLLLGVIALLGFVGCNQFFGLEPTHPIPPPGAPTNLQAMPGDRKVSLTWDFDPDVTEEYHVFRSTTSGVSRTDYPKQTIIALSDIPYTDSDGLVNGTEYFYRVSGVSSGGEGDLSSEVSAIPQSPYGPFVTFVTGGTPRLASPTGAWYGMAIQVQSVPITVRELGRAFGLGLTTPHMMRLVDAQTNMDLSPAITIDMNSDTDGAFKYGQLVPPADLQANQTYYVLSQEFNPGDQYLEQDALITNHRPEAKVLSAVYSDSPGAFVVVGAQDHTYGPVNIKY